MVAAAQHGSVQAIPMSDKTMASYVMALCGDCSNGPPCRCSNDHAEVNRVWSNGRWFWVATCTPEAETDDR
jgi:hypothetical protein